MKVSFDFDGCLGHKTTVQKYAKKLISKGIEVWIVTTRWDRTSKWFDKTYYNIHKDKSWREVHQLSLELCIPIKQIKFTNYQWKGTYFDLYNDFIWHLDDNIQEIEFNTSIVPIIIHGKNRWKEKCNKLLNI